MALIPKNWNEFQHYKDRAPTWIKLHRSLLDDFAFCRLPVASRALAPFLWLLASEDKDGRIDGTFEEIAFRLRMTEQDLVDALKPLIDAGFFSDDSNSLAECKQSACLETEGETEKRKKESCRVAKATATENPEFEEFWKSYPKRTGDNPKSPARKLFEAAVKQGADPKAIIAGVKAACERNRNKIGTEFIPQAVKWLRDRRWEDYQPESAPPVDWRTRMSAWSKSPEYDRFWPLGWGAPPGDPQCQAPPDLLREFGAASEKQAA